MLAKRKGVTARWGLKEAWSETATRRTETGYEAVPTGTSGRVTAKSISIEGSTVYPAGARRRLSKLTPGDLRRVRFGMQPPWPPVPRDGKSGEGGSASPETD